MLVRPSGFAALMLGGVVSGARKLAGGRGRCGGLSVGSVSAGVCATLGSTWACG